MAHVEQRARPERETIHSGHFMVSHFEAEAQDDDTGTGVAVPDEEPADGNQVVAVACGASAAVDVQGSSVLRGDNTPKSPQQISIETSLAKLFRCMSLAYRQKLTSPKWNRFKGIKLRWKDKIRLNNVIWRCWHMQFIKRKNTGLVCQFASPLDVDLHVKPETTILEGKYWKRRNEAVTAEYKKWRMFHTARLLGRCDSSINMISEGDMMESFSLSDDMTGSMLMDEDYINFMSDTLFSTITSNQPFAFPDTREIARGASLADFIQPSLGPLQPNLDDFMDTLEPLQDLLSQTRLPPVPEESAVSQEDNMYRHTGHSLPCDLYNAHNYMLPSQSLPTLAPSSHIASSGSQMMSVPEPMQASVKNERLHTMDPAMYSSPFPPRPAPASITYQEQSPPPPAHPALPTPYPKTYRFNAPDKIVLQPDSTYAKSYTAQALTPAQSAPETVSLLQQPLSNTGRSYRERPSRPRIAQYTSQLPSHYQTTYNQHATHQMQYAQPVNKPQPPPQRTFKLPTQTVTPSNQQIPVSPTTPTCKENFRSTSLPLGAQLNADWSISGPPQQASQDLSTRSSGVSRVSAVGAVRRRSRSSSSGGASAGGARRVPPPLASVASEPALPQASVASEPALPQASVVLAHLLTSHQHSQSMYKLTASSEDVSARADLLGTPFLKQNSPADDASASMHSGSPATSSPPLSPSSPSEPRRATHLHAEQKRRYNIKNGFDTLQALIPHLNNNPAAKVSKAAMLQKGAEYIKQLKAERNQIKEEMESLRNQIECLNNSISNCHSLLPATGAPVSRARAGRLREMFARHVASRTLHNWKYWIFSVVTAALAESFSNCVSCGSSGDLVRSTLLWAEQHCSLVEMRPAVLKSLRLLCSITDILAHPERLPDEARAAAAAAAAVKPEPI